MPTTIESLELEVQSSATSATGGIDALSASLSKLKNAVKGGVGLTSVANQLNNLNTALKGVDASSADKIDKLASSLSKLSGLGQIKISSSIGNQLKSISSAATSLNAVDLSGLGKLSTALQPLSNLGKSNLSSFITQLSKLPQLAQTLNGMDMAQFTSQIQQLSNALAPLARQLNTVSAAFNQLPANIRRTVSATNALPDSNNRAATSYVNLWAKARMATNVVKNGARIIASWITESNSYIEDLNLFTASMGEYASEAQKYAEQVGDITGIDPGEWMRNQGIFMTITKGFGVASDRAYTMSKNLTQLGYDLSSFFNISFSDSMQKLTSGISGELEPLRRLGYDLSQARLQAIALSLGIEKSFNDMTQAEKAQLRYYAILTQVTVAQGDMARTLTAPANQIRILKSQVTQCARALGNIFIPVVNAVIPYLIAFAKVLRSVINLIGKFVGFTLPEVDYSGISSGSSAVDDLTDSENDATSAAKKLKNALTGIDELNIISPADSSSSGSGAGVSGSDLGFELPEYDFLDNAINKQVEDLVKKFKEWAGLTDDIDTWAEFFHTKLGKILILVGEIAAGFLAWKFAKAFLNGLAWLQNLKNLGLSTPLTLAAGIVLTVTGLMIEWTGLKSIIQDGIDKLNLSETVGGAIMATIGGSFIGKAASGLLAKAGITSAAIESGMGAGLAGALFGGGIAAVVAGLPAFVVGIYSSIKEGLSGLSAFLTEFGATLTGAGVGAIGAACGAWAGPVGIAVGALIGVVVGALTNLGIYLYQNWDDVKTWASGVGKEVKKWFDNRVTDVKAFPDKVKKAIENFPKKFKQGLTKVSQWLDTLPGKIQTFFSGLVTKIDKWFDNLWKPIKDYDWNNLGKNIGTWLGNAVKSAITFVTKTLPTKIGELTKKIGEALKTFFTETLPKFFTEWLPDVVQSAADFFLALPEKFGGVIKSIWEGLKEVGSSIIGGIIEGFKTIWQAIKDFCSGLVEGFKEALGIYSPSTVFRDKVGKFLGEGLLEGILLPFKTIAKWVKKNIITPIANAIKKNPISDIVIGIANKASEWWSDVKSWWADATKDGISVEAAVSLAKKGWSTVKGWIGNIPTLSQMINLMKSGWESVKSWVGNIPVVSQAINLIKSGWETVKGWVGNIPTLSQTIDLIKSGWQSVKEWIGTLPIISQAISLLKSGWSTVKNWIGSLPVISQAISLLKSGWTTVKNWIGSLPVISQTISLLKSGWTTVKNWIGSIPTLEQAISLLKSGWTTVKNWIGTVPVISQAISLAKSGWTTVKGWIGSIPAIDQAIKLIKSGWTTISAFVGSAVSVSISLVKSGWTSLKSWIGSSVSVGISLFKSGWSSIKSFFGLANGGIVGANGGVKAFATGGSIGANGMTSFWDSIPKYANGTANAHGTMFVAGEAGAEVVGHVNGNTEVLNRSQLAAIMQNSVVAGMAQFTGYWRALNSQMAICANAVIRSVLVSADLVSTNFATQTSYDPTNTLAQTMYEDSQRANNNSYSDDGISASMIEFYRDYVEPTLKSIATDTKRQADKEEQTIVQVGNRTITDAVTTQQKANGYKFAT